VSSRRSRGIDRSATVKMSTFICIAFRSFSTGLYMYMRFYAFTSILNRSVDIPTFFLNKDTISKRKVLLFSLSMLYIQVGM
jgi:hypothetical protein